MFILEECYLFIFLQITNLGDLGGAIHESLESADKISNKSSHSVMRVHSGIFCIRFYLKVLLSINSHLSEQVSCSVFKIMPSLVFFFFGCINCHNSVIFGF